MEIHTLKRDSSQIIILLLALLILALSGCSGSAKANLLYHCGIISEEDRQAYIDMVNANQLDENGNYAAAELNNVPEPLPPEGSVHVTFAENAYITVQYYLDTGLTEPVNPKQCYLMPGNCIYASEPVCNHPSSKWYGFDRFCIYAYDESNKRTQEFSWTDETAPLLIRIPADYTGSEISVVPMGKYENRILELTDYYTDSTGHQQELDGTWTVNDEEAANKKIDISPVAALTVDYTYDAGKYEFVASYPDSFYHEKGRVLFETTFASDGIKQYSIELRKLEGSFRFDPHEYHSEHGTVSFSYNGLPIDDITYIEDGGSIHYTATPDAGYRVARSAGDISVDASNPDKTSLAIKEAIRYYPDEDVTVNLLQPEMGGTIEYFADGKPLFEEKCTLRCGTVITMNFKHWNHWIVDSNARKEYTVTAAENQTVSMGVDLSRLFTESEEYMPTLNIIVKDSMKSAKFAVLTSENGKEDLSYATGSKNSVIPDWMGQNDREIFGNEKVGTGRDIVLAVTNDTIVSGYAMKLEIIKKDNKGNESKSIQYVTDLPVEKPIGLYGKNQPATSTTTYESVVIIVSKVEVSAYAPKSASHAAVTIWLTDENDPHTLQIGEVLESSRNVEVTIMPDNGYYIAGSRLNNGVYSETMSYAKWEKDYQKILDKHPAQKLWYVTLDTSDDFGTCIYKLDGIARSGRVGVRDGQTLTMEYTLTDSNYQIARAAWALWESIDARTITISVDESLDGRTIQRSDYISIERKEG